MQTHVRVIDCIWTRRNHRILRLNQRIKSFNGLFRNDGYVACHTGLRLFPFFFICLRGVITRFKKHASFAHRMSTCPHLCGSSSWEKREKRGPAIFYSLTERIRTISHGYGTAKLCGICTIIFLNNWDLWAYPPSEIFHSDLLLCIYTNHRLKCLPL